MVDAGLELGNVVTHLRKQLLAAQADGEGEALKLRVEDIEVEFQVGVSSGTEAEGGVKFWVFNASAKGSVSSEAVQKIKLKLKPIQPGAKSDSGQDGYVDLAAEEPG